MPRIYTRQQRERLRDVRIERKRVLGYINSPETRAKLSKNQIGRKHSEATKLKMRLAKLGKPSNRKGEKHSDESKKKMSNSHIGQIAWNKGKNHSLESRKKMSLTRLGKPSPLKGKKLSEEHIQKLRDSHLGIVPSEESRIKMSNANRGEKHWNWIKDRSKLQVNHDERRSSMNNYFIKQVKDRDNNKCKISNHDCNGQLEVHHILSWRDNPELRYDINNGITLCHFHHPRKYEEEKRLSPYFKELILKK